MVTKSEKAFFNEGNNKVRLPDCSIVGAVPLVFFSLLLFGSVSPSLALLLPLAVYALILWSHKNAKLFYALSIAVTAAEAVLIVFFRKYLGEGINRFTNRIYELSEERQAYIYTMYEVSKDKKFGAASEKVFAVFVILLAVLFFAHCSLQKNRIAPFGFIIAFAVTEIYYGIFPSPVINSLIYAGLVLMIVVMSSDSLNPTLQAIMWVAVALAVIGAATYFIYPAQYRERNPDVSELNDKIRDFLEEGVPAEEKQKPEEASQQEDGEEVNPDEDEPSTSSGETEPEETETDTQPSEKEEEKRTTEYRGTETEDPEAETAQPFNPDDNDSTKHHNGGEKTDNETGGKLKKVLSVFLLIILALVLAVLIWAAIVLLSRRARQKKLASGNKEASLYAFEQSVKLLEKLGFEFRNVPYSVRKDEAEELVYDGYGDEFAKASEIRERILYGGRDADDKDREDMLLFYTSTRTAVLASCDGMKQFIIKYVNLL